MARARSPGNGRLEEAVTLLIQNQASFLARVSEMDRINAENMRRIDERFARIDERFARIEATLAELLNLLHSLPDAVREKFGFRPPQ